MPENILLDQLVKLIHYLNLLDTIYCISMQVPVQQ